MIKIICTLAVLILTIQLTIFASLPPLFEDIAEIQAILSDHRLNQLLESGESILEITKTKNGFLIKTNDHKLFAKVVYKPINRPGPLKFDIEFGTPQPLERH